MLPAGKSMHMKIDPCKMLSLFILVVMLLVGCASGTSGGISRAKCGNGVCEAGENSISCPSDCNQFSGSERTTVLVSEELDIAVLVGSPKKARYPEGAGVVVIPPPVFFQAGSFSTDPDLASIGLIQVSFLWPGDSDPNRKAASSGTTDNGGELSQRILRDVIRFASGITADKSGLYLSDLTDITPLTSEVGVYAYDDAGVPVISTFMTYGDVLPGVQYFIGRENPTVDTLACLEAGYIDEIGQPLSNPFYNYPESYDNAAIHIEYTNARWDSTYRAEQSAWTGRPYLDLNGDESPDASDFFFSGTPPEIMGKRNYSRALTQALLDNKSLAAGEWPSDLATPDEARTNWPSRQIAGNFYALSQMMPDLKTMLVFSQLDHVQTAQDKPHIHQFFQGLRFEAGLWVRMNPDRAYVQALLPSAGNDFPDNPANTQPENWTEIGRYAYPNISLSAKMVPLAAVSEMADRAHFGRWDENLGQTLFIFFPPTEQP
jgi:hypothetical protein